MAKKHITSPLLPETQKRHFEKIFNDYLEENNLRWTKQRQIVLNAVLNSDRHVDAETITKIVKKIDPSLGIATVYRTLRMLTLAKLLVERFFDGVRAQFEFADNQGAHHDHIICTSCKKIEEFFNEDIENLQIKIAKDLKFELHNHRMELFGICQTCQISRQS